MDLEDDRIRGILEDIAKGDESGRKFVYDREKKKFRESSPRQEDPDCTIRVDPTDLDMFAADRNKPGIIVLPGELIEGVGRRGESQKVSFGSWDNGDVYTLFESARTEARVPGTLYVSNESERIVVAEIGSKDDQIRVVVYGKSNGTDHTEIDQHARGYVLIGDTWLEVPTQVLPIEDQLFSRVRGLFETGAISGKRVLIIGQGSGGSNITWELVKTGIMNIDMMDHDRLEVGNTARHHASLFHVGRYKSKYMADMIREKNPYAKVQTWETRVSWENIELVRERIRENDLTICATDDRESKIISNKIAVEEVKPLIIAGCSRRASGGQILFIRPCETLCYQCFLQQAPEDAREQEISSTTQAERIAYSDRPVPVEPGLSTDIAPISIMVVKLAIQYLLKGKPTTLRTLDEDLVAPWYVWLNRREEGTDYESLEPLEFNVDGFHILRWYGVNIERDPSCRMCGDCTAACQDSGAESIP